MGKFVRVIGIVAGLGGSALSAQALETVDLGIALPVPQGAYRTPSLSSPESHEIGEAAGLVAAPGVWRRMPAGFIDGAGSPWVEGRELSLMAAGMAPNILSAPSGPAPAGVAGWGAQLLAALAAVTVLMWRRVHSR